MCCTGFEIYVYKSAVKCFLPSLFLLLLSFPAYRARMFLSLAQLHMQPGSPSTRMSVITSAEQPG